MTRPTSTRDEAVPSLGAQLNSAALTIRRLEEALRKIYNSGQSAEPDHWKFRCMARETAAAALAKPASSPAGLK